MSATTVRPPISHSPTARAAWALRDAWIITRRDLAHWVNQPGPVILGWAFPILVTLMFGTLFGGAIQTPGGGEYYDFLIPGMLAMTMLFGLETTMLAVTNDAAKGVTDRFRSLPMNGAAVVLGRCIADILNAVAGLAIMVGTGLLLGWRPGATGAAMGALGLLLLFRFGLLWVGIYLGLMAKGPESVVAAQILVWPVLFLSSAFIDTSTMPNWLAAIANWSPLSATASAARELFDNPRWAGDSWIAEHAELMAIAWPVAVTAVFLPLSVRGFRALGR